MLIPSHYPPANKVKLGSISLTPGPRIEYFRFPGSEHIDSIDIDDDVDRNILGEWLLYHGFITNSRVPVDAGFKSDLSVNIKPLGRPSQRLKDYGNITNAIYLNPPKKILESIQPKSYKGMYDQYTALEKDKKYLIKSYLLNLNDAEAIRGGLLDATYWQITKNYSIIERVLGGQEFCSNVTECSQCGKTQIQHHPLASAKWLKESLCDFMGRSSQYEAYFNIIDKCRKEIRHPTVHESKITTARTPDRDADSRVDYTPEKTLASFQKDKHALRALDGMLESITWYLLMHHVFRHGVFGRPTGYSVISLTAYVA